MTYNFSLYIIFNLDYQIINIETADSIYKMVNL